MSKSIGPAARFAAAAPADLPVFVDVTADWCITCIANEQAVLFTDEMRAAFDSHGVVYMVADWTNYDADIAAAFGLVKCEVVVSVHC